MRTELENHSERYRIEQKLQTEEYWRIPWQDFEISLGLTNFLQTRNLNVKTFERATEFFRNCGFDLSDPTYIKAFQLFYGEAIFLLRHTIMSKEERDRFRIPRDLLFLDDPRHIIMVASDRAPRKRYRRLWACAILKVCYAIACLEYSGKLQEIDETRKQMFGRISKLIRMKSDGTTQITHKEITIDLHAVDWKESKTRSSIVMKFLHKPESIVDEVFDYLGVRFVVKHEAQIPLLLKLLINADIIIPHQVVPARTRNTLLNMRRARHFLDILVSLFSMDSIDYNEFREMCERMRWTFQAGEDLPKHGNQFSSSRYRSIQLTVRHLVRIPNPAGLVVNSLLQQVRHYRGLARDDTTMAGLIPQEIARYFPLEIQILDTNSYDVSRFGPASHEQYKAAQLEAVRNHVLRGLLAMTEYKMLSQDLEG